MRKNSISSFLIYIVSLVPFPLLYVLSDLLYLLLYRVFAYRTKVVRENLRRAFPGKSIAARKLIERKFYRFLPDLLLESLKMRTLSERSVRNRFQVIHTEELRRHFQAGRPVIGVTAHYGNWEWGIHRLSVELEEPVIVIYKPLSNRRFDQLFNWIRARFGAILVPMRQTLRVLLKYRNTPHISLFVADQTPTYQESNYFIPFLNQETLVYTGPGRVAKHLNAPIVFFDVDRIGRGRYQCTITTLVEDPSKLSVEEMTDIHNRFTEEIIKKKPDLWMWSHRRWKRTKAEAQRLTKK